MWEVKKKRRNIFTIWLDYKKAFDSVPHEWLLYALQLAKVPAQLIEAIKHLTNQWGTVLHLIGKNETILKDVIKFLKCIFQGDSLSVLLFILTVNPLSFMLRKVKGYSYGTYRNSNITHNVFVDDLKLCASNINILKKQPDLVTTFSKDTGMTFGGDKCAYQQVENGKLIKNTEHLEMNLFIKPIKDGDTYKYLRINENISYVGIVNKERVTKEYYTTVKKTWKSELSSFNKVIAHNTFAITVLTTTVVVIDWTIKEIKEIDIRTRKHLTMTRNFHPNGDVDKLYLPRSKGGRGIKMIARMFESRITTFGQYLAIKSDYSNVMKFVCEQEQQNIIQLQHKLLQSYNMQHDETSTLKHLSKQFMKADLPAQKERYTSKVVHGYYERKIVNDIQIDKHLSNSWKKDKFVMPQLKKNTTLQFKTKNYRQNILRTKALEIVEKHLIVTKNADCVPPMLKT